MLNLNLLDLKSFIYFILFNRFKSLRKYNYFVINFEVFINDFINNVYFFLKIILKFEESYDF